MAQLGAVPAVTTGTSLVATLVAGIDDEPSDAAAAPQRASSALWRRRSLFPTATTATSTVTAALATRVSQTHKMSEPNAADLSTTTIFGDSGSSGAGVLGDGIL